MTCPPAPVSGEPVLADYLGRLNADDGLPVELEPLRRMLAHFLATDPGRFWVAVQDPGPGERIVGFGSAHIRGDTWFLSMLFVEPRLNGAASAGRSSNGRSPEPTG